MTDVFNLVTIKRLPVLSIDEQHGIRTQTYIATFFHTQGRDIKPFINDLINIGLFILLNNLINSYLIKRRKEITTPLNVVIPITFFIIMNNIPFHKEDILIR